MLRNHATPEQAAKDAGAAYGRMKYLQVPEPQPVLEQFLPPHPPTYLDSAWVLAEAQHQFEAARSAHKYRERLRLDELEAARSLYLRLQLAMWPQGVTLDPDVAAIESIERQVDTQNTRIERQVNALTNLLAEGLDALPPHPDGASTEPIDRGTLDPHSIAERIETALTTMQMPIDFHPKVRAA